MVRGLPLHTTGADGAIYRHHVFHEWWRALATLSDTETIAQEPSNDASLHRFPRGIAIETIVLERFRRRQLATIATLQQLATTAALRKLATTGSNQLLGSSRLEETRKCLRAVGTLDKIITYTKTYKIASIAHMATFARQEG